MGTPFSGVAMVPGLARYFQLNRIVLGTGSAGTGGSVSCGTMAPTPAEKSWHPSDGERGPEVRASMEMNDTR